MILQQAQARVDLLDQTQLPRHEMDGPDAARADGFAACGHLIVNVTRAEHRLRLIAPIPRLEAARDSLLAVAEDFPIGSLHSKCAFSWVAVLFTPPANQAAKRISSFSLPHPAKTTLL
jgi:hypothetical protein